MRAAFALIAALAVTACQVNVEGAPCRTPGLATDCPDGQACGTDLKCSRRVRACPVNATSEFAVDPSNDQPALYPTGVADPKECRFPRLRDALGAAAAYAGAATVRAYGTGSIIFGVATGETYPLDIAANVTLAGTGALDTIIRGEDSSPASILTVRGTVQGVGVENVSMTGTGVELACGATGQPALRDVSVSSGATKLAKDITFNGACGAVLQRVDASGANVAALEVVASSTTAAVMVSGSRFHDSGMGVQASGAKLVLQDDGTTHSEVTDNTGIGIYVGGTSAADVTLSGVLVARNGGTGVVIGGVPTTSAFRMTACNVTSNATSSPTQYGPVPKRNGGGLLFSPQGLLSAFQMQGNLVHANDGGSFGADEIAFENGSGWVLSTSSCSTANEIGCVGTGYSVSVITPGTVDAQFTRWPSAAPATSGFVDTASPCTPPWSGSCP